MSVLNKIKCFLFFFSHLFSYNLIPPEPRLSIELAVSTCNNVLQTSSWAERFRVTNSTYLNSCLSTGKHPKTPLGFDLVGIIHCTIALSISNGVNLLAWIHRVLGDQLPFWWIFFCPILDNPELMDALATVNTCAKESEKILAFVQVFIGHNKMYHHSKLSYIQVKMLGKIRARLPKALWRMLCQWRMRPYCSILPFSKTS